VAPIHSSASANIHSHFDSLFCCFFLSLSSAVPLRLASGSAIILEARPDSINPGGSALPATALAEALLTGATPASASTSQSSASSLVVVGVNSIGVSSPALSEL